MEVAIGGEVGNENGGTSGIRFRGPTAQNTGVEALVASLPDDDDDDNDDDDDDGGRGGGGATQRRLYKLMVGTFHFAMWTGPQWPNASSNSFAANHSHWDVTANCLPNGCLFDLTADPTEHYDIAGIYIHRCFPSRFEPIIFHELCA